MKPTPRHSMRKKQGAPAGVTLIETMVSLFIFAIIVSVLGSMFVELLNTYSRYSAKTELAAASATSADRIADAIRLALSVEASHEVDATTYTTDADTLVLKLSAINGIGEPIFGTFDYVIFTPDEEANTARLIEIIDADPASSRKDQTVLLLDALQNITFIYSNVDATLSSELAFEIRQQRIASRSPIRYTSFTYAKLRNN